ncbi:MAG: type II toxin-antitoxin system VapC family toxin [Rubrobacteraceae bacterium]
MRLYFDNNVYNRPFDDQSVPRNRAEARAVEALFEAIGAGEATLVSSFVVDAENRLSPDDSRRERVRALIGSAGQRVGRRRAILQRARILNDAGLAGRDALHLAAAEQARADYFVTCDDKLIKRAGRIGSPVEVVSPLELFEEG